MLLPELPAETLLPIFETFVDPEDAFFLRLACRALRPVATTAFLSWVSRALLEERDARKAYDALVKIRLSSEKRAGYGLMSVEAIAGVVRLSGAADPESRTLVELAWHVVRRPEMHWDGEPCQVFAGLRLPAPALGRLLDAGTVPHLVNADEDGIYQVGYFVQKIGFPRAELPDLVLGLVALRVEQRWAALCMAEQWTGLQLWEANAARLVSDSYVSLMDYGPEELAPLFAAVRPGARKVLDVLEGLATELFQINYLEPDEAAKLVSTILEPHWKRAIDLSAAQDLTETGRYLSKVFHDNFPINAASKFLLDSVERGASYKPHGAEALGFLIASLRSAHSDKEWLIPLASWLARERETIVRFALGMVLFRNMTWRSEGRRDIEFIPVEQALPMLGRVAEEAVRMLGHLKLPRFHDSNWEYRFRELDELLDEAANGIEGRWEFLICSASGAPEQEDGSESIAHSLSIGAAMRGKTRGQGSKPNPPPRRRHRARRNGPNRALQDSMASEESFFLSEPEWLALFPAKPPPGRGGAVPGTTAPPAASRIPAPRAIAPPGARADALVVGAAMVVPLWLLGGEDLYGRTQLIAGSVAVVLSAALEFALITWRPAFRAAFAPGDDWSGHPLAVLVRWSELATWSGDRPNTVDEEVADKAAADPDRAVGRDFLLSHDKDDPHCPCPLPTCAGALAGRAAVFRALET
ncbi:hypothetical protein DFJ74DRAFT_641828 [Hyaloraphidium curvatum]|nr:hypothetical protein DFJ74DRAFT_641828 [Hyaloraphidium curvatum]